VTINISKPYEKNVSGIYPEIVQINMCLENIPKCACFWIFRICPVLA
jgi:hypothetical protein